MSGQVSPAKCAPNNPPNNIIAMPKAWQLVFQDIFQGIKQWDVWLILGWQDIRFRYRRSTLGPFWITLSMAVTISCMAFLYAYLFKTDIRNYFPHLAAGMIVWNLFSMLITDGTQIFLESAHYLRQVKLPYTIFVLRLIVRSFIVFSHNLIIMVPVIWFFHIPVTWALLFLIPGFLLIFLAAFPYVFILAILGARFRDVTQIVSSIIQVVYFATPIMWNAEQLSGKLQYIVTLNPFAHFLSLLRAPLLGHLPNMISLLVCISIILIGFGLSFLLMKKVRKRIVYWL